MTGIIDHDGQTNDTLDACRHAEATATLRQRPVLVIRLRATDGISTPPDVDHVIEHLRWQVGRLVLVSEAECFCHGYPIPALVATVRDEDVRGARRLVDLVTRLSPLLGDEVVLKGSVHVDAERFGLR